MRGRVALGLGLLAAQLPLDASATQRFVGRVGDESGRPVPTALVSLVDVDGTVVSVSIADAEGDYLLEAPAPATYRLEGARIGYDPVETPLLEVRNADRTYRVDLEMRSSPIPIEGISVEVDRVDIERSLQLIVGMHPNSLRNEIIHYEEIQNHIERGHDLPDLVRWSNTASLLVFRTPDGPCFSVRRGGCLQVHLNGHELPQGLTDAIPLDMAYAIAILMPGETVLYPRGAVLVFTENWLR